MSEPLQGLKQYNFFGMTVTVPDQNGRWVKVVEKAIPPLSSMPGSAAFTPIRVLANVVVVDFYDPNVILKHFDPPIKIEVGYQTQDLFEAARVARRLKLAYWDGDQWVVFTDADNNFSLLPPTTGAVGEVTISDWIGDPPIAWGS